MQKEVSTFSTYRFRSPLPGEGRALLEMIEDILAAYGLPYDRNPDDCDLEDLQTAYAHPAEAFWVIESEQGGVVGCGGLKRMSASEAEIRKMYIQPQARGKGLGKQLMHLLLAWAKQHGYVFITLETNQELIEARALYEKFGFQGETHLNSLCHCDLKYMLRLITEPTTETSKHDDYQLNQVGS